MVKTESEELLENLRLEHRDLDEVVDLLIGTSPHDTGKIQRFKKRKLQIRDQIERLERQLQST
ncbi:MAG: YdcH family protein [Gammaproteobacteria bacterium]|nr:YdcH family protein [Gammaproteobacteria bacterium]